MTTPSFAIAPIIIAICSGVARTSNCPIADCAVCGSLIPVGKTLSADVIGTSTVELKPNRSACACRASAPRSMPSWPNAVLQEIRSASRSEIMLVARARRAALVGQRGIGERQVEHVRRRDLRCRRCRSRRSRAPPRR